MGWECPKCGKVVATTAHICRSENTQSGDTIGMSITEGVLHDTTRELRTELEAVKVENARLREALETMKRLYERQNPADETDFYDVGYLNGMRSLYNLAKTTLEGKE